LHEDSAGWASDEKYEMQLIDGNFLYKKKGGLVLAHGHAWYFLIGWVHTGS
jgi:hypothetical protein